MSNMPLRYFYQVDLNGQPIPGSNTALVKKPTSRGAGQRWVEYTPLAEVCCNDAHITVTSIGAKQRFYVRVSEATKLPISGTLEKRTHKPPTYLWQEVIARRECATPRINVTVQADLLSTTTFNLIDALGLTGMTMVAFSGGSDDGGWLVDVQTDGDTSIDVDSGISDTVTLEWTNGTCNFAFLLTIEPQA